jgi:hypothetical protein
MKDFIACIRTPFTSNSIFLEWKIPFCLHHQQGVSHTLTTLMILAIFFFQIASGPNIVFIYHRLRESVASFWKYELEESSTNFLLGHHSL